MAKIKLTPEKKVEISQYLTTLYVNEKTNRTDLTNKQDEWWMRHLGIWSAKKDKNFPWKGSADVQTGITMYSDSALEARFSAALNTVKFCDISSNVSEASHKAAKRVENYINNYWQHITKVKSVLLSGFQYPVVEGTWFIKIIPKKLTKKVKKFRVVELISDSIKKIGQYMTGADGKMVTDERDRDEFVGAIWENLPRRNISFDNSVDHLSKCLWASTEFDKSASEIWNLANGKNEEQRWHDVDDILKTMAKNEIPSMRKNQQDYMEDQSKNEYLGYIHTLTARKTFIEFWIEYNMGTVDKPDYKKMMFIVEKESKTLVYEEENEFFDKRIPIVSAPFYRMAGKIDGQGMPQRLASSNDIIDIQTDQAIDNNTLCNTLTGTIITQPGMDLDKMQMQPGKFIPVKAHDNVKQWVFNNRLGDIQQLLNFHMSIIEKKSLVSDYSLGRESEVNKKATMRGTAMLLQEYGLNLDPLIQNIQNMLKEAMYQTLQCFYEFMPAKGIKYSYKGKVQQDQAQAGQPINPMQASNDEFIIGELKREDLEYIDDWDINILRGAVDVMLETEKQSAMFLYQTFAQDQSGEIDMTAVRRNLIEVVAPRQAQTIIKTPLAIQKEQFVDAKMKELAQLQLQLQQQAQILTQVKQQHDSQVLSEKAQLEESKFIHALQRKGASADEIALKVAEFRKQYIAREAGNAQGINPMQLAQESGVPQQPAGGING